MPITKEKLIQQYGKALNNNTAAVFAGAGLSSGAGFVNWMQLLEEVAQELDLKIGKEAHDLIGLAQYYLNKQRSRSSLNEIIMEQFSRRASLTPNHLLLAKLPISTYWTTNYDCLIEKALEQEGKIPDTKVREGQIKTSVANSDVVVYKMHGDISDVENTVLTRDDYEKYNKTHPMFREILEGDLLSKTFLFLGFSFTDPNLNYVLSKVRVVLDGNTRPHYCILRKINRKACESDEDFNYQSIKQSLHIEDLKRFSIQTVLVDEYEEITEILESIYKRYRQQTIFISGSAAVYEPFSEETAKLFLHSLSFKLAQCNYKIVSGFGLGVGHYIINGVVDYTLKDKSRKLENSLRILPFPQDRSGDLELPEIWKKNRYEMISDAGIAIFLFGNKRDSDDPKKLLLANGMEDEFDIAREKELMLLPIVSTDYMAKKFEGKYDIHSKIPNEKLRELYVSISNSQQDLKDVQVVNELVDNIIEFINLLNS